MSEHCAVQSDGEHRWSKAGRDMVQRCDCGVARLFPAHKAVYKRVPPALGGGRNLQMCQVCGYVREAGAPTGTLEAKIHE